MLPRRQARTAIVVALAGTLLAGCATRMTEQELRTTLGAIEPTPARRAVRRIVPVHAQTPMEAWVLGEEARHEPGSSPLSQELADGFALGRIRQVDYVIGGPYPKLTDRIVLNGLKMNEGHALPGLRIFLVGLTSPSTELLDAAKARRVRVAHRPLP
jgi:hypothetical protein